MKEFPILYKRTRTGAIQQYALEVINTGEVNGLIQKRSGQLSGAQTLHQELVKVGKNLGKSNETSPMEQALSQAESDWKRKRDEGYKSLEDLGIRRAGNSGEFLQAINPPTDMYSELSNVLELVLPKYNTDSSGNVKPMLAPTQKTDLSKVKYPVYIQPKLDGVRCLMVCSIDEQGQVSINFLSRSGKPYNTLGHIQQDVLKYATQNMINDEFILDGEIYSDELTFQEVSQAVKKQYPNSLKLKFHAYDVVTDELQDKRLEVVGDLVRNICSDIVTKVPTYHVSDSKQVMSMHDKWVQEGYEGAMIRLLDGTYDQGQRSKNLLKVKEFDETEFIVIGGKVNKIPLDLEKEYGITDAMTDSFTFTCKCEAGEFDVKPKGSRAQRAEYIRDLSRLASKEFTVRHWGWTDKGLPRNPVGKAFRDYD